MESRAHSWGCGGLPGHTSGATAGRCIPPSTVGATGATPATLPPKSLYLLGLRRVAPEWHPFPFTATLRLPSTPRVAPVAGVAPVAPVAPVASLCSLSPPPVERERGI